MNFTPGPWEAVPFNFSCVNMWDIRVKNRPDDDPSPIADMVFQEANARLIAAAPEMAELLDDVLIELGIVSSALPPNQRGHIDALHDRVNALLTRIEGEEREGE